MSTPTNPIFGGGNFDVTYDPLRTLLAKFGTSAGGQLGAFGSGGSGLGLNVDDWLTKIYNLKQQAAQAQMDREQYGRGMDAARQKEMMQFAANQPRSHETITAPTISPEQQAREMAAQDPAFMDNPSQGPTWMKWLPYANKQQGITLDNGWDQYAALNRGVNPTAQSEHDLNEAKASYYRSGGR